MLVLMHAQQPGCVGIDRQNRRLAEGQEEKRQCTACKRRHRQIGGKFGQTDPGRARGQKLCIAAAEKTAPRTERN